MLTPITKTPFAGHGPPPDRLFSCPAGRHRQFPSFFWEDVLLSSAMKPLLLHVVSFIEPIFIKDATNEPDLETISTRSSSHT
jgi:hypothetical protein